MRSKPTKTALYLAFLDIHVSSFLLSLCETYVAVRAASPLGPWHKSETMVTAHPVPFQREFFLPCVYGYACTMRRAQASSSSS